MNFRQLRSFLAVAEHLHFTDAATNLGIAQPPPTQQVLKFERGIGTQLFVRYSHCVEFTEAGQFFRERAGRIVEDVQQVFVKCRTRDSGNRGGCRSVSRIRRYFIRRPR